MYSVAMCDTPTDEWFSPPVVNSISNDEGEEKYLSYLFGKNAH
jgi:hypothetical protein